MEEGNLPPKKKKLSLGHLSNWICSSTGEGSILFILRIQTPPPTTVGSSKSHFSLSPKLDLFLLLPPLSQFYFLSRSRSFSSSLFWGEMASRRLLEIHPSLQPVIVALLRPIAFKLGEGGGISLWGSIGATVSRPQKKTAFEGGEKVEGGSVSKSLSPFLPLFLLKWPGLHAFFGKVHTHDVKACSPLRLYVGLRGKKDLLFFTRHLFLSSPAFPLRLPEMHQSGGGKEERPVNIFRHFPLLLSFPTFLSPILPHHISRKKYWKNQRVYII